MRAELQLVPYARRKKQSAPTAPLEGPMIDEYGTQYRAAMEMSRREHEARLRAEQDPRGKRHIVNERAESSDDE